jgi:hypothetical protein
MNINRVKIVAVAWQQLVITFLNYFKLKIIKLQSSNCKETTRKLVQ